MKNKHPLLESLNSCEEAVEFSNNYETLQGAWNNCERGDWMLWLASKLKVNKRKLTLAKALCAKTVIHLMKDERSIRYIEISENYGKGLTTEQELKGAYNAAYDAAAAHDAAHDAYAHAHAAAAHAAHAAAAHAAHAHAAAAHAAHAAHAHAAAAYAAHAADAYAHAADAYAVGEKNQKQTSDICREILTEEVFNKIKTI